ncbi:MAG: hypothetical protein ACRC0B_00640 [Legionella sp.]
MPGNESPTSDQQSSTDAPKQNMQRSSPKRRTTIYTFGLGLKQGTTHLLSANDPKQEGIKRKTMTDEHSSINESAELTLDIKNEDDNNFNQQNDNSLFKKRQRNALMPLAPIPLTAFTINTVRPLPAYEKDLAPEFYQTFLQQLFKALAPQQEPSDILKIVTYVKAKSLFILTGSAAQQLQDSNHRNPNDIDILCNQDLHQAQHILVNRLNILNAKCVFDDQNGTMIISYNNKCFKLQLIDRANSPHCFPAQQETIKINGIVMLKASTIPKPDEKPTLADEDPTLIIQLDPIAEWQTRTPSYSPK